MSNDSEQLDGGAKLSHDALLDLVGGEHIPTPDEFRELIRMLDSHDVLAKVFILEGVPYVFEQSPMKYVIFREQVAERFGVGSQDVCIVGSAKLGWSPSPYKFGTPFEETSDVDVVVISEGLFYEGSRELFSELNRMGPPLYEVRPFLIGSVKSNAKAPPQVPLRVWRQFKEATRNFVYENFNPGLLPSGHPLRIEIFDDIGSTAGLFLALHPKVFVSRIRCRIFRTWKAAEAYYANSLREVRNHFLNVAVADPEIDEDIVVDVTCPSCDRGVIRAHFADDSDQAQKRFCFDCGVEWLVSPDGELEQESSNPIHDCEVVGNARVVCDECNGNYPFIAKRDDTLFSVCYDCHHVLRGKVTPAG